MGRGMPIFAETLMKLLFIGIVSCYPNNVPSSPDICSKMTPGHGPRPQQSRPPYQILLNKHEMQGGNNLQIVVQGKKGNKFKGFYLQVRDQDGLPIGTFLVPDERQIGVHTCFNHKNNAAHHKNLNDKESITVYWKAPESFNGKVKVQATVLKDFKTYWVDVKPKELVSVTTSTSRFFPSSDFAEKRTTETTKSSKAARILNYNPYSPYSPLLSSSWDDSKNVSTSTESLLPQPSEDSSVAAQERQLPGIHSFDFHDSLFSGPKKSKKAPIFPPDHPKFPLSDPLHHQHQIQHQHLPLHHRHHKNVLPHLHHGLTGGSGSLAFNKLEDAHKEQHPHAGLYQSPKLPLAYGHGHLPADIPYHTYQTPTPYNPYSPHEGNTAPLFSNGYYDKPIYAPHFSHSIQNDKGNHYIVNHHYPHKPLYPKPAIDPSYPNSGYFPKDILTKLTSYIPNIYNALANNPLFNFNIDNTIESIWKPIKGVPSKLDPSVAATSTKVEMPKYGYLVYNPVRNNPYFVIPAENEDEFVANHLGRRKDAFSYA